MNVYYYPLSAIYALLNLYAIFLSFHRNGGFHLGAFLAALFFPWIYIAYALAVPVRQTQASRPPQKQGRRRSSSPQKKKTKSV